MKLDVASAPVACCARRVRAQEVREAFRCGVIDDDGGIRLASHANVELVVDTGLPEISGLKREIHITELVRSRVSANNPRANGLAVGVCAVRAVIHKLVSRDRGPMRIEARPVVVVLQVAPRRRTMLASAGHSKVRLGAVVKSRETAQSDIPPKEKLENYCF